LGEALPFDPTSPDALGGLNTRRLPKPPSIVTHLIEILNETFKSSAEGHAIPHLMQ